MSECMKCGAREVVTYNGVCPKCLDDPEKAEQRRARVACGNVLEVLSETLLAFSVDANTRDEPWRLGFAAGLKRAAEIAKKLAGTM